MNSKSKHIKGMTTIAVLAGIGVSLTYTDNVAYAKKGVKKGEEPVLSCPIPVDAPEPGILVRESFGRGNDNLRPSGGKGRCKDIQLHDPIQGFWVEYPGSKDSAWLAPSEGQTWRVCGGGSPHEQPSPLQPTGSFGTLGGCISSEWSHDQAIPENPTALMPFPAPDSAYQVSMEGWSATPFPALYDAYISIGLTNSTLLYDNLISSASLWLKVWRDLENPNYVMHYEFRTNGSSGEVLASGEMPYEAYVRMVLRYDPVGQVASASLDGIELGFFPVSIPTPGFAGFEGVGIMDNFIIRELP